MTPDLINALRDSLRSHLTLRKSRLESFCVLVMGVLLSRSVNLSHLAGLFPTSAEISSNYRRLQRFFEQVTLEPEQLAQLIAALAGLGKGPWLIALDRTNWKFGRRHINILMLAAVRGNIAIPLMWLVLDHPGSATAAQCSALLDRFCAVFGTSSIAGVIGDREFMATKWIKHLVDHRIPFILRLKQEAHIKTPAHRHSVAAVSLFQKVKRGGRCYLAQPCVLGSRNTAAHPIIQVAALRLKSDELIVIATNIDPQAALDIYKRRWTIETLFAACKTRGFNLEDTHITHPERISKLVAVIAVAFAFAHSTGQWRAKCTPIRLKSHRRKAQSMFRYGFDLVRKILIQDSRTIIWLWNRLIKHLLPTKLKPSLNQSRPAK